MAVVVVVVVVMVIVAVFVVVAVVVVIVVCGVSWTSVSMTGSESVGDCGSSQWRWISTAATVKVASWHLSLNLRFFSPRLPGAQI